MMKAAPTPITIARVALLIAVGVSCYLLWTSISGSAVAGCGGQTGCATIVQTRYGSVYGIPVSAGAVAVDLILLLLTFGVSPWLPSKSQRRAWAGIFCASLIRCFSAAWFVIVQAAIVRKICPWCLADHAAGVFAAVLLMTQAARGLPQWAGGSLVAMPARRGQLIAAAAVAACAVAGLIIAQEIQPFENVRITDLPINQDIPASRPAATPALPTTAAMAAAEHPISRHLTEYDRRFNLYVGELPLLGLPSAKNVAVTLFDYSCPHCRKMHALLTDMVSRSNGDLAIITLPMPLCSKCNPYVTHDNPGYENSCDYARLALAIFRANPVKFAEFDQWMWQQQTPPPVSAVEGYADQLIGKPNLERSLADHWVSDQLTMDIELYAANARQANSWRLPQVMIGQGVAVGMPDDADKFEAMVRKYLKDGASK